MYRLARHDCWRALFTTNAATFSQPALAVLIFCCVRLSPCGVADSVYSPSPRSERCLPLAPLLFTLQSLSEIDPLCIAHEVSFLGITALQSPCVDEREALLRLVGSAVYATSRPSVAGKTIVRPTSPTPAESDGDVKLSDVTAWSLETLVYPIVSMASAGNAAAAEVLPVLEGALIEGAACSTRGGARAGSTMSRGNDRCAWKQSLRHCSTAFIAIHHLCLLDGDDVDLVRRCEGLERRARELESAENSPDGQAVALRVDLESAFCVLAPLLLRPRTGRGPHSAACAAVVAVVRAIPPLGVRLLPFVLYAIRKLAGAGGESGAVLSLLRVLPELGRHKVAAKPVAGVIQALSRASQPTLQGVGLRLAATLIGINSRCSLSVTITHRTIPGTGSIDKNDPCSKCLSSPSKRFPPFGLPPYR